MEHPPPTMTPESIHSKLARAKLSLPGYLILRSVTKDAKTMGALAKIIGTNIQNTSGRIDRMEGRGLVSRSYGQGEDRRCVSVGITEAGSELLGRVEG